jgi:predicted nucleotidyltransferase
VYILTLHFMTTPGWILHKLHGEILKEKCSYMDMMDWVKTLRPTKQMHFNVIISFLARARSNMVH